MKSAISDRLTRCWGLFLCRDGGCDMEVRCPVSWAPLERQLLKSILNSILEARRGL